MPGSWCLPVCNSRLADATSNLIVSICCINGLLGIWWVFWGGLIVEAPRGQGHLGGPYSWGTWSAGEEATVSWVLMSTDCWFCYMVRACEYQLRILFPFGGRDTWLRMNYPWVVQCKGMIQFWPVAKVAIRTRTNEGGVASLSWCSPL